MRKIIIKNKKSEKVIIELNDVIEYEFTSYGDNVDITLHTLDNVKYTIELKDEFNYKIIID